MMTMSDDGERTCPLCAEEMDITDQQLKPCKCGYEVCVWCWHHVMEMAEKEETEGRCPACRTPYDKDRIVKMAANCERMVAEINAEKKQKTHKARPKTPVVDSRDHLTSVRVIQRNLVYIIGLPLSICDENMLERKEYFGQYGKVVKVSISRPTGASAQQASSNNSTFSVYITYVKEEEAVRCIQAVHNFVLEGKALRACFGTTKYCHTWLRSMACNNPDCLYLHDVGSQEDSFTKDEIISAYTRSRVPVGGSSASQKHAGFVLPPPADDFPSIGAALAKQMPKNGTNIVSNQTKISPPNSSAGKSTLPAAASWGLRNLSAKPTAAGAIVSQALSKPKLEPQNNATLNTSTIASTKHKSAWNDDPISVSKEPEGRHVTYKPGIAKESKAIKSTEASLDIDFTSIPSAWNDDDVVTSVVTTKSSEGTSTANGNPKVTSLDSSKSALLQGDDLARPQASLSSTGYSSGTLTCSTEIKATGTHHVDSKTFSMKSSSSKISNGQLNRAASEKITEGNKAVDANIDNLSNGVSLMRLDSNNGVHTLTRNQQQNAVSNKFSEMLSSQAPRSDQCFSKLAEPMSLLQGKKDNLSSGQFKSNGFVDWSLELQTRGMVVAENMEDIALSTDKRSIGLPNVIDQTFSSPYLDVSTSSTSCWKDTGSKHTVTSDRGISDSTIETRLIPSRNGASILPSGLQEDEFKTVCRPGNVFDRPGVKSLEHEANSAVKNDIVGTFDKAETVHKEESSITSDIWSLDFDPWDDSLSSANNFVRMLGQSEKQDLPFNLSTSWASKTCNESRFSFARQDSQGNLLQSSLGECGHNQNFSMSSQNSQGGFYQNGFANHSLEGPNEISRTNVVPTFDRAAGMSRTKGSAPPGFSTPSRIPPPGFSSHDRSNHLHESSYSENRLVDNLLGGNNYQRHLTRISSDIEFIDPAILAVGKGRNPAVGESGLDINPMSTFPSQFNTSNSDARIELLMQQSMPFHQNLRLPDHIENAFTPMSDNYLTSRVLAQNHGPLSPLTHMSLQQQRNTYLANGQWDAWNDLRVGDNMGMTDMSRNNRFGLNGFYPTTEENNFHIPSSGDLYNRAFRM